MARLFVDVTVEKKDLPFQARCTVRRREDHYTFDDRVINAHADGEPPIEPFHSTPIIVPAGKHALCIESIVVEEGRPANACVVTLYQLVAGQRKQLDQRKFDFKAIPWGNFFYFTVEEA